MIVEATAAHHCIVLSLSMMAFVVLGVVGSSVAADAPVAFDLSKLRDKAGVHPRLYLTADRVVALKKSILSTHAAQWAKVARCADGYVKSGPPAYGQDDYSGLEQLWQRPVGNALPVLAMAYVLSGDRKYLESAKTWAAASCGYPTWGLGYSEGLDLATGHQLYGLALFYDWCYADLDEMTRQTIRQTLLRRGNYMYEGVTHDKIFWRRTYLQNHLWVNGAGMTAAALATFDETDAAPDVGKWLGFAIDGFDKTFQSLGDDGASQEGVPYWEYGMEYMLKYMDLSRELLGRDLYGSPWFKKTVLYPLYLSLPRDAWTAHNSVVDLADSPRSHWYGPEYILRKLAVEYKDGHANWYAQQIDDARINGDAAVWLNLVWFDPAVRPTPPDDLPTLHHFDDMDVVAARSDWSGKESLVVFKCGPFVGHKAVQMYSRDPGGSHAHPDANHFDIFALGQWLVRDDGYRPKMTGSHNMLLVNDRGQLGEGKMWFDAAAALAVKSRPRVVGVSSTPTLDRMTGDATDAYPRDLGLKKYRRHLLFLKPDVLIVIDDIETASTADMELRFHPESSKATRAGQAYTIDSQGVTLRVDLLTPDDVNFQAESISTPGRAHEQSTDFFTLRLSRHATTWRNATAFSWSGARAPVVELEKTDRTWTFRVGGRSVLFDWEAEE